MISDKTKLLITASFFERKFRKSSQKTITTELAIVGLTPYTLFNYQLSTVNYQLSTKEKTSSYPWSDIFIN